MCVCGMCQCGCVLLGQLKVMTGHNAECVGEYIAEDSLMGQF